MSRYAVPREAEGVAAIGAAAAAFVLLAGLVALGAFSSIDQYAVDHWMPSFELGTGNPESIDVAHQFYPRLGSPLQVFCNLWTFPASAVVSAAVVGGCCVVLRRRGRTDAAFAWAGAWVLANVLEVIGKHVVHRPELHTVEHGARVSFDSFGHAFPSGHAVRAMVVAAVVAAVWKRAAVPAFAWAAVALVALVVAAAHTPSDVLGGTLLALPVVLAARTVVGAREAAT